MLTLPQPASQQLRPSRSSFCNLLIPEADVDIGEHCFYATSSSPWLRLPLDGDVLGHGWIKLRYRSSLYDDPVRPVLRFRNRDGSSILYPLNAPIFGAAEWIGPVPAGTAEVHVSPAARPGPFHFEVEQVKPVSFFGIIVRLLRRYPLRSLALLASAALKDGELPWRILNVTSLDQYATWVKRGTRPLLAHTLDRPRVDWSEAPVIRLLTVLDTGDLEALRATVRSLKRQTYSRWRLHALAQPQTRPDVAAEFGELSKGDSRFSLIEEPTPWWPSEQAQGDYWCGVIGLGDTMPDYALATMIEAIGQHQPLPAVVYSDEDVMGRDGTPGGPTLKPDWSPYFNGSAGYIGRLTLIRGDVIATSGVSLMDLLGGERTQTAVIASRCSRQEVFHVRRVLCHRSASSDAGFFKTSAGHSFGTDGHSHRATATVGGEAQNQSPHRAQFDRELGRGGGEPLMVSLVMPTGGQLKYLKKSISGILNETRYDNFELIVLYNSTTEAEAFPYFDEIAKNTRVKIVDSQSGFNFSRICNIGAGHARGDILCFVNDDLEIIRPDWLEAMVRWAALADVGAVGAKLKFPAGTLQHAGVIMSMSDLCVHNYHYAPEDYGGYLDQLKHPHEVLAVTAACLAVERKKFEAIGGFDAENLPVELNDVDLCLRLAARGWHTIWTPEAELLHYESASRGAPPPEVHYQKERAYFRQRWHNIIRDDPFFHPALTPLSHRMPLPFEPTEILLG